MKKIAFVGDGSSTLTKEENKKKNITRITFKIKENYSKNLNDLPEGKN